MRRLVLSMKNKSAGFSSNSVRVDRGTPWGNPFIVGTDGDRNKVCDLFEAYAAWRLLIQPDWLESLRDKDLVCWCAPERCHAETLLRLANRTESSHD